jgi:hypothetical protein
VCSAVSAWQLQVLRSAQDDTVFLWRQQRSGRTRWCRCCFRAVRMEERRDRPRGGGSEARQGGGPGDDAGGQGSSSGAFSRVQANDMCGEMREHVGIPDGSEFLSELGANGFAVVVAGGDVPGYPSPSRCGRARYKVCCINRL